MSSIAVQLFLAIVFQIFLARGSHQNNNVTDQNLGESPVTTQTSVPPEVIPDERSPLGRKEDEAKGSGERAPLVIPPENAEPTRDEHPHIESLLLHYCLQQGERLRRIARANSVIYYCKQNGESPRGTNWTGESPTDSIRGIPFGRTSDTWVSEHGMTYDQLLKYIQTHEVEVLYSGPTFPLASTYDDEDEESDDEGPSSTIATVEVLEVDEHPEGWNDGVEGTARGSGEVAPQTIEEEDAPVRLDESQTGESQPTYLWNTPKSEPDVPGESPGD